MAALRDTQELKSSLDGCADADLERARDILGRLSEVPMTLEILKQTKVGKSVARFKKVGDSGVADEARRIIKAWKGVAEGRPSAPSAAAAAHASAAAKGSAAAASAAAPAAAPAAAKKEKKGDVEAPASWASLPPLRQRVRKLLARAILRALTSLPDGELLSLAECVENAIEAAFPSGTDLAAYQQKFRQLCTNLPTNTELCEDLLGGALEAERLVKLSAADLLSQKAKEKQRAQMKAQLEQVQLDYELKHTDEINKSLGISSNSGVYRCPKCKSNNTSYTERQTRSADEPMTVFCRCMSCGARWRIYP